MSEFKRAVMQFSSPDGATWSESYYARNPNILLTNVRTNLAELLAARVQLFQKDIEVVNAYVSDDDTRRDALYVDTPKRLGDGTWSKFAIPADATDDNADFAWSVLRLQLTSGTNSQCHKYLSGIPDFVTFNPQKKKPFPGKYTDGVKAFIKELTTNWAWKGISTLLSVNPKVDILKVEMNNTFVKVVTKANHGLGIGDAVMIASVKNDGPKINGVRYVATVPDATTVVLNYQPEGVLNYKTGGYTQTRKPGLFPIEEAIIRGMTNRKRGNSVGRRRGRARKHRS